MAKYFFITLLWGIINAPGLLYAQNISHADGSALKTKFCYEDITYPLAGNPSGGSFSGCGIQQHNGQWYFNPVLATQGVTVFPYQCNISYTINNQTVSQAMLIYKPVKINPPLPDSATCSGHFSLVAQLLYAGAYDYQWTPAAPLERADTSTAKGFVQQTTTFVFIATDHTSGCSGSDTVTITRYSRPEVNVIPANALINARDEVQLQASGADFYYWQPSRWLSSDTLANPLANPQAPIIYQVIGTNEYGCTDSAEVTIKINEDLFVPNAFTPNGDGVNDRFRVENIGYQGIEAFHIFNRWGERIYQTLDGANGWDGTQHGRQADMGTYYYYIRLGMRNGSSAVFKGEVMLMR